MRKPVKAIILDVDLTLVIPNDRNHYAQFGHQVVSAIGHHYSVTEQQALDVATYYRKNFNGAEFALFRGDVHVHFPNITQREANIGIVYDHLVQIETANRFQNRRNVSSVLKKLRTQGVKVFAMTSSPDSLAVSVLKESGFDVESDFDKIVTFERDKGPPKILGAREAFSNLQKTAAVPAETIVSIGDVIEYDIIPAAELGMQTYLIAPQPLDGHVTAWDVYDILNEILDSLQIESEEK